MLILHIFTKAPLCAGQCINHQGDVHITTYMSNCYNVGMVTVMQCTEYYHQYRPLEELKKPFDDGLMLSCHFFDAWEHFIFNALLGAMFLAENRMKL